MYGSERFRGICCVGNMVGKSSKARRPKPRETPRKFGKRSKQSDKRAHGRVPAKPATKAITVPIIETRLNKEQTEVTIPPSSIFSIDLRTINGDTSIGDLIVAFPRTREILMKHGLRFDVEEAGYLYMTLNVFSAIHGLTTSNLVQELHTASKEPAVQTTPSPLRPVPTAPAA